MNKCKSCDELTLNNSYCDSCINRYSLTDDTSTNSTFLENEGQSHLIKKYLPFIKWAIFCFTFSFVKIIIITPSASYSSYYSFETYYENLFEIGLGGFIVTLVLSPFTNKKWGPLLLRSTIIYSLLAILYDLGII